MKSRKTSIKSKKTNKVKSTLGNRVVIKLAVPRGLAEKLKFVDNHCKNDYWFARSIELAVESKIQDIFISTENKFVMGQINVAEYKKVLGQNPTNLVLQRKNNLEASNYREISKLRNEILLKDHGWFIGIPRRINVEELNQGTNDE